MLGLVLLDKIKLIYKEIVSKIVMPATLYPCTMYILYTMYSIIGEKTGNALFKH